MRYKNCDWTKKHAKLVGRVILANFLDMLLWKYRDVIEEVKGSALFKELSGGERNRRDSIISGITVEHLSGPGVFREKAGKPSKIVAEVVKNGNGFSIRYTYEGFNEVYRIGHNLRESALKDPMNMRILYKLRRISSRNELSHRIIEGVIENQKRFLCTGNPADLAAFSQVQLAKWLNERKLPKIDISWISRLVNRLSIIVPSGEERILRSFFPTRKDLNKRLIKQILDKENGEIESGRLKRPLWDGQIRANLESEHGVKLSRYSVGLCRKEMGIPPATRRLSGYKYPPPSANFSMLYPLAPEDVVRSTPSNPGVYEFRLNGRGIEYPNGKTEVIYIGSTKDIKKRLREHLGKNSRNGGIRDSLKKFDCSFRYIQLPRNWKEEEKELYKLFVSTYGSSPKCNKARP